MEDITLSLSFIFIFGFLILFIVKYEYKKLKKKLSSLVSEKRRIDYIEFSITDKTLNKVSIQENINEVLTEMESFIKLNFKRFSLEEIFVHMVIFNRHLSKNLKNSDDDNKQKIGLIMERYTGIYTTFDPQKNTLTVEIDTFLKDKSDTVKLIFHIK